MSKIEKDFLVHREHIGDRPYKKGDVRSALPAKVQHLIPKTLTPYEGEVIEPDPDDLTALKGVGEAYAERLNNFGINTFEDLLELETAEEEDLSQAVEILQIGNLLEDGSVFDQARELIKERPARRADTGSQDDGAEKQENSPSGTETSPTGQEMSEKKGLLRSLIDKATGSSE